MKQYKFDYIKENVEKWGKDIPRDRETLISTPFGITMPHLFPKENNMGFNYYPPKDYYGETIEDIDDWMKQRERYCEELEKEYKNHK